MYLWRVAAWAVVLIVLLTHALPVYYPSCFHVRTNSMRKQTLVSKCQRVAPALRVLGILERGKRGSELPTYFYRLCISLLEPYSYSHSDIKKRNSSESITRWRSPTLHSATIVKITRISKNRDNHVTNWTKISPTGICQISERPLLARRMFRLKYPYNTFRDKILDLVFLFCHSILS